jgi:hypothetical protein
MQPVPNTAPASPPITEYGEVGKLHGVKTVFLFGLGPDVRNNMLKEFAKHPEVRGRGLVNYSQLSK